MRAKVRRIAKRGGGAYGAFIDGLEAMGATLCPICQDYAIHTSPCLGWSPKFGGNGECLNQPYHLAIAGTLETEELAAEDVNAQEAA